MTRLFNCQTARPWLLALCMAGVLAWPVPAAAQTARTQERDLYVSVVDSHGTPVLDLAADAFVIKEDHRVREVLRVRRATDPMDLAILIDNSQAADAHMLDLRRGLGTFLERVGGLGHVAIVSMADRPTKLQDYTADPQLLQAAVDRLFSAPGSGVTSLEAVDEVCKGLEKRDTERANIVLIWLGGPEFSNLYNDTVLRRLRESGAALHVLTLDHGTPADAKAEEGHQREIVFDEGPRESGGHRHRVLTSMALAETLDTLAAQLSGQYRVTYARPDSLIPARRVSISVRTPGLTARCTPVRVPKRGAAGK
jgi:VWFA-related protein